ncbi:hypothetical protein QTP88_009633 [Uroleucon formosanum]
MLKRLREVLMHLRFANLMLKPAKCSLGAKYIEFFGFVIGGGTICPGDVKTRAVQEFPWPNNIHEIRRFLGLTGFFRRFVENYATVALPLTNLTKTGVTFIWRELQQEAFDKLKNVLVSRPVMAMFNQNAFSTEVYMDASSVEIGAMLLQRSEDGEALRLVYYISKKLTETKTKYHSGKLELMAVIWAVNKWRNFLLGIKFTDCQTLVYLRAHRAMRSQVARWHDLLQEYEYDIQHRPGTKMAHVDALSRAPVTESGGSTLDDVLTDRLDVCVTMGQEKRVLMAQTADVDINAIIEILKNPEDERTKSEKAQVQGFELQGYIMGKKLFVIPKSMRKSITVRVHDLSGHLSVKKTKPRGRQPGLLYPIPLGQPPFDTVHMDHVGPFMTTPKGNKYILVMVDNLTNFTCLSAAKDTSADGVIDSLATLVQTFGLPNRMVTDRGTCFTGRKFEEFCDEKEIQHTLTSTRRPVSKRISRTDAENAFRATTRFRLRKTRALTETADTWTCPDELWKEVREASEKAKEKMKEGYDMHRHDNIKYVVGEIVVMTTVPSHTRQSSRLQNKYKGSLTITELKSWRLEEELDETSSYEDKEGREPKNATSSEDEDVLSLTERKSNNAEVRKSARVQKKPSKLLDYVC